MATTDRAGQAAERRPLASEDLLALDVITDARISPDGRAVVYVVKRADLAANRYRSSIVLVTLGPDGTPAGTRSLTAGNARASAPRWSPDGSRLAFVSDGADGGVDQLYVVDPEGGEPRRLTSLARGAGNPVWSPDGARLAFLSTEGNGLDDAERDAPGGPIRHISRRVYRVDGTGYVDDRFQHVWVVAAAGGDPRQVTRGAQSDLMPAWSPDGSRIAFVSNRESGVEATFQSQLYTVPVDGAAAEGPDGARRVDRGTQQAAVPAWSPDGSQIAYVGLRDDGPAGGNHEVFVVPAAGGAARSLTRSFDRSVGVGVFSDTWSGGDAQTPLFWSPGETVAFVACDRGRVSLFQADDRGEVSLVVGGDRTVGAASASSDGQRLAYLAGDFTNPCDLYVADGDGANERRLTAINAERLAGLAIQEPERMPFKSFDDRFEVDAWLIRPVGYDPSRRYPLVQIIHGGPHSVFGDVFFFDMQLWAGRGWNVLFINPRATQGYGEEFATANLGDWGGADWKEQEQALDLAIARGGVDPDRLAVTGLSYGGYMTDWIVTQTDRYRAAVSENGICNLVSFYGTADIGWYWLTGEWGPSFWDHLDYYMAHSPISHVTRARTPTLLLQSETDWRCPIEQGEQFYVALADQGVPTKMVRFPGESHVNLRIGKPRSRLVRREETLRWFERYL
ncbi:MAG TPA: S9 family peptidase [Thermomicrobiaceae bacterium]|nr:S9 family peptidase [Thermomicrobiaceae bacterium]